MDRRSFLTSSALALALLPLANAPSRADNGLDGSTVEVLVGRTWVQIPGDSLNRGMIFRVRKPDGSPVDQGGAFEVMLAMSDSTGGVPGVIWEPFTTIDLDSPLAARVKVFDKSGSQLAFVHYLHVPSMVALQARGDLRSECLGGNSSPEAVKDLQRNFCGRCRNLDCLHASEAAISPYGRSFDVGRIEVDLPQQAV